MCQQSNAPKQLCPDVRPLQHVCVGVTLQVEEATASQCVPLPTFDFKAMARRRTIKVEWACFRLGRGWLSGTRWCFVEGVSQDFGNHQKGPQRHIQITEWGYSTAKSSRIVGTRHGRGVTGKGCRSAARQGGCEGCG